MTGGFDGLVVNFFNAIPNTTRAYRSTMFSPASTNIADIAPDLYGTDADRNYVIAAMNPPGQRVLASMLTAVFHQLMH